MINPCNHCYLNSTLQIIFRIKDILFSGQNVNTNIEGRLVSFLLDSLRFGSETQMANFKNELAHFKSFYDGQIQRDVYECFIVRMSEPLGVTISVKVFLMIEMSRSKVVEKHAFG